jgi:acetyl-CoA acetyltransferase
MSLRITDPKDIAIVGVGQTDHRALYQERGVKRDANALAAAALRDAIADAGLAKDEIDGLFCSRVGYNRIADVLGIHRPHFVQELEGSGRMSGVALQNAVALIASGMAEVVACVYGNNGRSVQMKYGGEGAAESGGETAGYDSMFGMTSPGAYVSLMYQRYRQLYGAPEDALYPLAANNRRNATRNPLAVFQEELTHEQYMNSRYIAEPMRLFDYCIINDGGVAFIVTTMERARTLPKKPVRIAATAGIAELTNFYTSQDFFYEASREVADRVYRQSGYGPEDMDALQIYDNFLPTILFTLEGFGHAERGTAWQWVAEKSIGFDGKRPMNTSGSHTSESYMQGWALHVEAVKQIRGEAGARQVGDCNVVQYMCASPIVTSHVLTAA